MRLILDRPTASGKDKFSFRQVWATMASPHVILNTMGFFFNGAMLYGLALFLPTIVKITELIGWRGATYVLAGLAALLQAGGDRLVLRAPAPRTALAIVATAIDAQGNSGTAEVTIRKVDPATLPAQSTRLQSVKVLGKGRVRTLAGQVRTALPFAVKGKVVAEWQAKRGGRWKKVHGAARNADRPFKFRQRLKYGGQWRVRVRYLGQKPFKRSVSKWVRFRA